jgi:hypothetical protein
VSDLNGGEKTLMQLFNSFWYTVQGKSQLLLQRRLTRFLALHCQDICRLNLLGYVAQKAGLWIRIQGFDDICKTFLYFWIENCNLLIFRLP